ncbi:MAG: nucleotidyltransferase domain-containing protein [Clostridiales bacterium]|nr:nucleotidyltransferase domain-containing protein [Clostridiales bacterium]
MISKTGIKPEVIDQIRFLAKKYDVKRVILFGSRARGDFYPKSDIDLAAEGGDIVRFSLDVDEDTSTLLEYDIIDLGKNIQSSLRETIQKEGILLYEKV